MAGVPVRRVWYVALWKVHLLGIAERRVLAQARRQAVLRAERVKGLRAGVFLQEHRRHHAQDVARAVSAVIVAWCGLACFAALGCASEAPTPKEPLHLPSVDPIGVRDAAVHDVPGAPSDCYATIRIRVPADACGPYWPRVEGGGYGHAEPATLTGVDGLCMFRCVLPSGGEPASADWFFKPAPSGWRGEATCALDGVGGASIRTVAHQPGDAIGSEVGLTWEAAAERSETDASAASIEVTARRVGCPGVRLERPVSRVDP